MTIKAVNYKVNDQKPSLRASLRTVDGSPINLAGTTVSFMMTPDGLNTPKASGFCTIENASTGTVRYDWLSTDVNRIGLFRCEFRINYTDGTQQTVPSAGYIYIRFEPRVEIPPTPQSDDAIVVAAPYVWLRASLVTGNPVTTWTDLSGNEFDATGSSGPDVIASDSEFNGDQVLEWSGAQFLETGLIDLRSQYTIFVVGRQQVGAALSGELKYAANETDLTSNGIVVYTQTTNGHLIWGSPNTSWFWSSHTSLADVGGGAHIFVFRADGTGFPGCSIRVDGSDQTANGEFSGVFSMPSTTNSLFPGAGYSTYFKNGQTAEIIVFNNAQSLPAIQAIESVLKSRYGIV